MFLKLLKALPTAYRSMRSGAVTAPGIGEQLPLFASAIKPAAQAVASTATKAAPGIISKILRKGGGTGPIRKLPLLLTGLTGLGLAGRTMGDDTPKFTYTESGIKEALGLGGDGTAILDDYLKKQREAIEKFDYTGGAGGAQQAALNNYLAGIQGYAGAQGSAINKAYQDLAEETRGMGEQAAAESQMAATDIDRLYGDAATQAFQYGAGQGLTTGPSDVSGLAGVSGAMAEAPDTTRAYGQSLADWMGRQGIISRQDLESAGQSYMAQGIGTKSQMEAEAAALGSRAQYDLANRLAEMGAAANQQKAQRLFDIEQQASQAALEQSVSDAELSKQAGLLALQAPQLWKTIKDDEGMKDMWTALGVTNAEQLKTKLIAEPGLAQLLTGL